MTTKLEGQGEINVAGNPYILTITRSASSRCRRGSVRAIPRLGTTRERRSECNPSKRRSGWRIADE